MIPLLEHIKWLKKYYAQCEPFAPAIPFIQMAINNAESLLEKEGKCTDCGKEDCQCGFGGR